MNRDAAVALLERLHAAQSEFPGGGSAAALRKLLAPNITWTVPGNNRIAGTYNDRDEVLEYFRERRGIAEGTFRLKRRDVLVGDGARLAALVEGVATIRCVEQHWATVGLYELTARQIAACWLLPRDQRAFDLIWSV